METWCTCGRRAAALRHLHSDDCPERSAALAAFYAAGEQRYLERAGAALDCAADAAGLAKGYTFRARELRYDARGGMTEELERRRFEPGARWSVNGAELVVHRMNIFGLPLVHFRDVGRPVERAAMTRANGWLFLDLGTAGQGPPGGRVTESTAPCSFTLR